MRKSYILMNLIGQIVFQKVESYCHLKFNFGKRFVVKVSQPAGSTQLLVEIVPRSTNGSPPHFLTSGPITSFPEEALWLSSAFQASPVDGESSFPEATTASQLEPEAGEPGGGLLHVVATVEGIRGYESTRRTVVEEELVEAERSALEHVAGQSSLSGQPHHHLRLAKLAHGALVVGQAGQFVLKTLTEGFRNQGDSSVREGFHPGGEEEPVLKVGCNQPSNLSERRNCSQQLLGERHHGVKGKLALTSNNGHSRVEAESNVTPGNDLLNPSHLLHQLLPRRLIVAKTESWVDDWVRAEHVEQPAAEAGVGQTLGLAGADGEKAADNPDVLGNGQRAEEARVRNRGGRGLEGR